MSGIAEDDIFRTLEGADVTEVPDGFVIYDEAQEVVTYLNPTAAIAYTACDGTLSIRQIRALLCDAYDVDDEFDLLQFFERLQAAGLVCRVE